MNKREQLIAQIKKMDTFFDKIDLSRYSVEELQDIIKNLGGGKDHQSDPPSQSMERPEQ